MNRLDEFVAGDILSDLDHFGPRDIIIQLNNVAGKKSFKNVDDLERYLSAALAPQTTRVIIYGARCSNISPATAETSYRRLRRNLYRRDLEFIVNESLYIHWTIELSFAYNATSRPRRRKDLEKAINQRLDEPYLGTVISSFMPQTPDASFVERLTMFFRDTGYKISPHSKTTIEIIINGKLLGIIGITPRKSRKLRT